MISAFHKMVCFKMATDDGDDDDVDDDDDDYEDDHDYDDDFRWAMLRER